MKLYWCRATGYRNFGDALSPRLVEELSCRKVIYAHPSRARLVATGSILYAEYLIGYSLRSQLRNLIVPRLCVWGAGFLTAPKAEGRIIRSLDVHAVRGSLTRDYLWKYGYDVSNCVLGDPGLLYARLVADLPRKCHKLGIAPHYEDQGEGRRLANAIGAKFIDVTQSDPLNAIREIASCERILSSSLHGLVVADSLGIPNCRIRFSTSQESDFKFQDYYSAYGMTMPLPVTCERFDKWEYAVPQDKVQKAKDALLAAFPFPK